ncbi:MAG: nucleotidyltransferase domain-containing protein [Gammaproteobacteria bacterium]|nr:nucleotidyltransferase domain-containing protein [Gammaproteobacteria bacterium]
MRVNNQSIERDILDQLKQIEAEHHVKIILAVESGSRAWGFPSKDSDYDVRFIYCHEPDWYLSVFNNRDVIELPIDDLLDINGWDIKKSLVLLKQSNSALMEWLASPIQYLEIKEVADPIKQLAEEAFLPLASCHHYLSMAGIHLEKISQSEQVNIKKYLYALRPVLCCHWVIEKECQPPMLFSDLLNTFLSEGRLRDDIDELLRIKQDSNEIDKVNRNERIETYLSDEINRLSLLLPDKKMKLENEPFDCLFRKILK